MNAIQPTTLFDKIWASRVVMTRDDGQALLYVDRHILHEGSTPLAFGALRSAGRELLRPDAMIGMIDHTIPTRYRDRPADDPLARAMMASFHQDTREFGVPMFDEHDVRQGIVHIVGPEQGFTLPGTVMVCGDSHTSTNGAFGAFAFGIGTSEVEHVFATRTLWRKKPKNLLVQVDGELPRGVSAKDMILTIIGRLGIAGGTGHVIEYAGSAIRALSMQGRMTVCNMSIEAGARGGLIAPDETTFAYLKDRPLAPAGDDWERALESWRTLKSDPGASYVSVMHFDATAMLPMVTWGTTPQDIAPLDGHVPDPALEPDVLKRAALERALHYMGLQGGMRIADIAIDEVFIGSCTNGRIEDLRAAAEVLRGRSIATGVHAIVVPGSGLVKRQAEAEGLDEVFRAAGFEWRSPGCSLCLAMNDDRIAPGKRCASTSNRNFEGRQGREARTHLVSPAMAASAAVTGRLAYSAPLQGGNR